MLRFVICDIALIKMGLINELFVVGSEGVVRFS